MLLLPELTVRIRFAQIRDIFPKELPNAFMSLMWGERLGAFGAMGDLSVPEIWELKTLWVLWGLSKGRGRRSFLFLEESLLSEMSIFKDSERTLEIHRQSASAAVKNNRKQNSVSQCKARTVLYSFPSTSRLEISLFCGEGAGFLQRFELNYSLERHPFFYLESDSNWK